MVLFQEIYGPTLRRYRNTTYQIQSQFDNLLAKIQKCIENHIIDQFKVFFCVIPILYIFKKTS